MSRRGLHNLELTDLPVKPRTSFATPLALSTSVTRAPGCSATAALVLLAAPLAAAWAQEVPGEQPPAEASVVLSTVVVEERKAAPALTSVSEAEARAAAARNPGAVTVLGAETLGEGGQTTVEDALRLAPGVTAPLPTGAEQRISIRGSGVLRNDAIYGLRLMRDGLPTTAVVGINELRQFEGSAFERIEVYRGAAALPFGVAALGGAINFVSPTGYTADRFRGRIEMGSDSYLRGQVSSGAVLGSGFDVFASISQTRTDGFRQHAEIDRQHVTGNVGYRWNSQHESRLYLTAVDSDEELPGPLTLAQIAEDPEQASTAEVTPTFSLNYPAFDSRFRIPLQRVDFKHAWQPVSHAKLTLGATYQTINYDVIFPFGFIEVPTEEQGAHARFEYQGTLLGRPNRWMAGLTYSDFDTENRNFAIARGGAQGARGDVRETGGHQTELVLENHLTVAPRWTLVAGVLGVDAHRRTQRNRVNGTVDQRATQDYQGFAPRLGAVWQASDAVQGFANLSRSYEPPTSGFFYNRVIDRINDDQSALTLELGTRGRQGVWNWEVSLFQSEVKDEVLASQDPDNPMAVVTTNAEDTVHTGVEAGVSALLPLSAFTAGDALRLRFNGAWLRLRFDDDPAFNNNQLLGVPEFAGQLELAWRHPGGAFAGPTVEAASGFFADFANTVKAGGYAIYGFKAGLPVGRGLTLFTEARNLGDRAFAASTAPTINARGRDPGSFAPGATRSVFAGVEWRLP